MIGANFANYFWDGTTDSFPVFVRFAYLLSSLPIIIFCI